MVRKTVILQLALATLVGMPLIAVLVDRFSETVNLAAMILGKVVWWKQLAAGLLAGVGAGYAARFLIRRPFMDPVNVRYANVLGRFELSLSEIVFISLCAGIGEELLFRGAIQPFLGIFFTSLVFVAIHGYLNLKDWRLSVYGALMTLLISVMGWMAAELGLVSAIVAHTIIDIILLLNLQDVAATIPPGEGENESAIPEDNSF